MSTQQLLFLFLILCFSPSCEEKKNIDQNNRRVLKVEVSTLSYDSIQNTLTLPGTILPFEQVLLYSEVQGRVANIFFKEGEEVIKNAPLIKIDSDILEAQKELLKSKLNFALKEEARAKSLYESKAGSFSDYETTQGNVASLQAELNLIAVEIEKTTIRAPFSGRVGLRMISPGAFIGIKEPITKIVKQDPLKIEFSVAQQYANQVKVDQKVTILNQSGQNIGDAVVYAFDPIIESSTRSLKVRAQIEKNEHLLPGGFIQVDYNLGTIDDAFMISNTAVTPVLNGQQIWLLKNGKAHAEIVELGVRTKDRVQIIGNIKEGDTLIETGLLSMREGLALKGKFEKK
jgi:membrane fusion protein (multidrug efflux system)